MIHYKEFKQQLNNKSLTKSEVVGASNYLPFIIYCKYFIESQGSLIKKNDFNQDNTSGIRLEKNGKASSRQQTRHIKIRYFLMKDRVREDEINIIYWPTEMMVVDYFIKPL